MGIGHADDRRAVTMDAKQLRIEIVRPALQSIDMHSEAAENLVMGTAAQESRLKYVRQLGGGPALSLFQMEPETYNDLWANYLDYRADVSAAIRKSLSTHTTPPAERLKWDMRLGAIMCRVHYRRRPEPLPDAGDVWGMAAFWKQHYNTVLGAGTEQEFVDNYRLVQ